MNKVEAIARAVASCYGTKTDAMNKNHWTLA